jgi:hypothetical protein
MRYYYPDAWIIPTGWEWYFNKASNIWVFRCPKGATCV